MPVMLVSRFFAKELAARLWKDVQVQTLSRLLDDHVRVSQASGCAFAYMFVLSRWHDDI